jgi:hypothetical protein
MDYPGVSCEKCKEALEIDDVEPPCFNSPLSRGDRGVFPSPLEGEGQGEGEVPGVNACWIPKLDERGQRILELRSKLIALQGLVDSETILKMYDATIEDIEMLSFLEEELKKMQTDNPSPLTATGSYEERARVRVNNG